MGTTLTNGIYLPNEGEKNCYAGLKTNWETLDQKIADITALQQAVAGALHREIVASLPTTDIDPNTIYMILSGTSATENVYNEFMYVNNAWELIGTSATDLTNYYTKGDVDGLLVLKANASDLTSHTGDTTIHVTASDKAKWTNSANTVVLRLAKTALTPSSSTNAFSNLDDSTALKVGDKVMDTAGVLFEVTAIDTANSTFTIGTALIDLAQDSDVVHKSGNETIIDTKTFSNNKLIVGRATDSTSVVQFVNSDVVGASASGKSGFEVYGTSVSDANKIGGLIVGEYSNNSGVFATIEVNKTVSGVKSSNLIRNLIRTDGAKELSATVDNDCKLGTEFLRWSKIYGTEYYYGSNNVEFSTKFVTTDTNQTISGNKTFSSNVNVYNSDSATDTANIVLKNSKVERGSTTNIGEQTIFFLDKDNAQIGHIKCEVDSSGVSTLTLQCTNSSNSSSGIRLRRTNTGTFLLPVYNNGCNLGTTGNRWYDVQTRTINGLEPSSLSLPSDRSARIDISSYFTNTGTGNTNSYTVPANGYIFMEVNDCINLYMYSQTTGGLTNYGNSVSRNAIGKVVGFLPVRKGDVFTSQWYTTLTNVSLSSAYFIPCLGNV